MRGWDDPRMPTICGPAAARLPGRGHPQLRDRGRRGEGRLRPTTSALLEHEVRDVLNRTSPRRFGVLDPLKVVIENFPEGQVETMEVVNNPEDPSAGERAGAVRARAVDRARRLHGGAARRSSSGSRPGREVRLRNAYFITCTEVVKDAAGRVVELRCTYDPATRGGDSPDGRTAQGDAPLGVGGARDAGRGPPVRPPVHAARPGRRRRPVRRPQPGVARRSSRARCWSRRWRTRRPARPSSSSGSATSRRTRTRRPDALVFNRTLTLKDTWAKVQAKGVVQIVRSRSNQRLSRDPTAITQVSRFGSIPVEPSAR